MSARTAASVRAPIDAPADMASLVKDYERVGHDVFEFGGRVGDFVRAHADHASAFLRETTQLASRIFQKWNVEILYILALQHAVRFTRLQSQLAGISSRTLSLKLQELEQAGYLERKVYDERPVRIEYAVTEAGRMLARLTIPLVFWLCARSEGTLELLYKAPPKRTEVSRSPRGAPARSP